MAQFFKAQTNKKPLQKQFNCQIHDLDSKGQGVGNWQQKVVFVPGALPSETVLVRASVSQKNTVQGELLEVRSASELRVEPACKHYAVCGGCQLQHLKSSEQITHKQQALQTLLAKKGLEVGTWAAPIVSEKLFGYRRKIRLAVDARKQVKLGFRHQETKRILNLTECHVMAEPLAGLLQPLRELIASLEAKEQIGHVELQMDQGKPGLWLHQSQARSQADERLIQTWLLNHQVSWLDETRLLRYELPAYDVTLEYQRADFIQSNLEVNQAMVVQALAWLDLQGHERVLDLFCGIGNFSLPLARACQQVTGVEGVAEMVERAKANAALNQLDQVEFIHADLSERLDQQKWWQSVDAILLDPARAGAEQVVRELSHTKAKKVLYVSCNPTTLVRDAAILSQQGYQIVKAGVMDMFPQTHHLESMILFCKMGRK